jgi:hypothetical protein
LEIPVETAWAFNDWSSDQFWEPPKGGGCDLIVTTGRPPGLWRISRTCGQVGHGNVSSAVIFVFENLQSTSQHPSNLKLS